MDKNSRIYIAGHQGLVGSALMRQLTAAGYSTIITRTPQELDLRRQDDVEYFFGQEQPTHVFLAAAHVGGIQANINYPAHFIYNNLAIQTNVIHAAYTHAVEKLLFFGSSCIYPRACPQPMQEDYLLTGPLEQTNSAYATAKIAGLAMCKVYNAQYGTHFIACMPTNIYGPGDNFHPETSHVIPGIIQKIYSAHKDQQPYVKIWGSGKPLREFIYVDDVAHAAIFLMHNYTENEIVNIGTGSDISIHDIAYKIKDAVGFKGDIVFDSTMPDGVMKKLLCTKKINKLGWHAATNLDAGLETTIEWFVTRICM